MTERAGIFGLGDPAAFDLADADRAVQRVK